MGTDAINPADVAAEILDSALESIAEACPVTEADDDYTEIVQAGIDWERKVLVELVRQFSRDIVAEAYGPMSEDPQFTVTDPGPCPCECNQGGFCGGCGHAGCGGRR